MKKNKLLLTLLASIPLVLAACGGPSSEVPSSGGGDSTSGGGGSSSGNLDDGLVTNGATAKEKVATVADPRVEAYTAHKPSGEAIGNYKTIADAINAAVDYDVEHNSDLPEEQWVFDSYVTKIDEDFVYFRNKEGFTKGENDDQFWYYENGNALAGYNCWDNADSPHVLRNSDLISYEVTGYGTTSRQAWNSYRLLDSYGDQVDDMYAQTWELSSTMDAAVLGFPGRLIGVTGLKYTIDLTNVKIAPPYEGTDKTYAFIGFYAWQDYYVIANGIACDTSTGNWYQFIGTSRDDSFSDVTYNIGACVMTSTYNETGGYFVPDNPSLTMEIKTTQQYDSQFDEYYQLDKLKISIENGATFERDISDSTVNNFFPGYPLGYENSYAFIAGLDIKNNTVQSQYTEATDYFNGSFFTGLTVTDAQAYVPTSEEISDVVYGYAINAEWRGKWHDILLSNTEDTPDLYDYTVLNTCVCSSYTALNGHDVYDFSYTGNPVGNAKLGVEARQYQTKIDSLDQMSVEDLLADSSVLDEVATWIAEGSTVVTQRIRLVLDFAPYYRAKEKLENYNVTEEAKAVIEAIRAIEITDYAAFGEIYTTSYDALTEDEKNVVMLTIGTVEFGHRLGLYQFANALPADAADATVYSSYVFVNDSGTLDTTQLTVKQAFDELLRILGLIAKGTKWSDYPGYNDDPNNGMVKQMNGDNNFWPSLRVQQLLDYFGGLELSNPSYVDYLLDAVEYRSFYDGFYYPLYQTTKLALRINNEGLTALSDLTADELRFLNEVWTSGYVISIHISWNWNSGDKLETYYSTRARGICVMAGGDMTTKCREYFATVGEFLTSLGYTLNSNGWGVTASVIE